MRHKITSTLEHAVYRRIIYHVVLLSSEGQWSLEVPRAIAAALQKRNEEVEVGPAGAVQSPRAIAAALQKRKEEVEVGPAGAVQSPRAMAAALQKRNDEVEDGLYPPPYCASRLK